MREKLPDRRPCWTQSVKIDGQRFYLTVGEYEDGRPGELFIEANKMGTFARGALDSLARTASNLLQHGAPVGEVVHTLRELNFPPSGDVVGSPLVSRATSVSDWIAQELEAAYPAPPAPDAVVAPGVNKES